MRFIQTNEPGEDDFSKRLSEFVARVKENEKFKESYARMNLHDRDLIRETKKETTMEAARSLYANGVSLELIAKSLKMTVEQVEEIVNEKSPAPAQA